MDGRRGAPLAIGLRFIIPLALQSSFYGFDYAATAAQKEEGGQADSW